MEPSHEFSSAGGGIRHVIAHGATWGEFVPREFCDRVLAVALTLCMTFLPCDRATIVTGPLVKVWNYVGVEFGSACHPKTILQKMCVKLYKEISALEQSTKA